MTATHGPEPTRTIYGPAHTRQYAAACTCGWLSVETTRNLATAALTRHYQTLGVKPETPTIRRIR